MSMKQFIILNLIITNFIIAEDVGDECVPNDTFTDGVCTLVTNCDVAIREIKKTNFHGFYRCGFIGMQEVVCCPHATDKFGPTENTKIGTKRISEIECEKTIARSLPPLGLHILGGETALPGEFPHMVALGFDRGNGYEFDCGGSVVSKTYILTAAHCVDTLDRIEPSIVRAGVLELGGNTWNEETDYRIAQIIPHPNYTRREKYHDLTLLRLEKELEYSSNLNAVCLDTNEGDPTETLTITGWGTTSNTRDIKSPVLLKAKVTFVPSDKCGESYTHMRKLPQGIVSNQLCAGDPDGVRDTCQGDSGGPLQAEARRGAWRAVGVTSFGRGCGSPVPGVYTRLAPYVSWIESVVWPDA